MTTADLTDHNTTAVLGKPDATSLPAPMEPTLEPSTATPYTNEATQPTSTFSITSFVLGIVSVVAGWTLVAPTVGLILGIIALRRKAPERTLALWGVWLNGAMLAISALIAFGFFAILAAGLFGGLAWSGQGYGPF